MDFHDTGVDNKDLCNVLLKWLQTLSLKAPHRTLHDISDGVAMAEALNQIAPECFDDTWFSKIKKDVGSNWRLKVSNLKKIVEKIHDFYQECDSQHIGHFAAPDVLKIGGEENKKELARLLQLILGCAVNCRKAQEFITKIRSMDENSQTVIMQSIQDLERIQGHAQSSFTNSLSIDTVQQDQMQQIVDELQAVTRDRDQMTQRCLELDSQISLLQEEKNYILDEKKHLEERLLESVEDPLKGNGQMRRQIEDLKEELYKAETSRDDYRLKFETQEREMTDLKSKFELLQETAGEARLLKDELDILRDTADRVEKYESTLQSYKKKLEELGDLKRQVKVLETKNIAYIQQNMELEQEIKKTTVWKSQLDIYKKQVTELHQSLNDETNKSDKLEFEIKKMIENISTLKKEKDRLIVERDSLKEANEELKCCQTQQKRNGGIEHSQTTTSDDLESVMDLKQKLVRLQHENTMLKMNQKDPEEDKITVLQTLLDDTRQQYNQLRLDNRKANQRIMELESDLKEQSDENSNEWKSKIKELQNKLQCEKDTRSMDIEEKNAAITEKDQLINLLQVTINQKDLELQEWEEKHKKCIEKAKSVVKSMDMKSVMTSDADINVLHNKLLKANSEIMDLKKEQECFKMSQEHEEKLMATAFYKLAQTKMQESVDQRVMNQGLLHSQTFLSKHRHQPNKNVELPIISK
ncbi:protein Hook homolog 3-like [Adelges cooleyi]|uniref:protein Hook homolog 3-like n=1 Tax=Adelges cooleyi TaxID=133065 RepID=UPI00217FABBF|nr:protein Hook homolog 3-like [Adelges cooleyi]XP_050438748.1 protein Hook homolog 3-like [Adelges cooleyi]